jgi:hypothetical protein
MTSRPRLFHALADKGAELIVLHLMKEIDDIIPSWPLP